MWVIPMEELRLQGNVSSIALRTELNSNNQGFETCKYLVKI